jgi:hypothetical protein
MTAMMTPQARFDHLCRVVTSARFLTRQGLGNEVPFFICPYPAGQTVEMNDARRQLLRHAANRNVRVLDINLFDMAIEMLEERGILDEVLEIEAGTGKDEFRELLQGVLDPHQHLVPQIAARIAAQPHEVVFLSGVGEVYPFVRASLVLENLQSTVKDTPLLMFFPGEYVAHLGRMLALHLFGQVPPERYYRAFDVFNYEV